jgi:hypothetical protein
LKRRLDIIGAVALLQHERRFSKRPTSGQSLQEGKSQNCQMRKKLGK